MIIQEGRKYPQTNNAETMQGGRKRRDEKSNEKGK
jgi:hypothetical protein